MNFSWLPVPLSQLSVVLGRLVIAIAGTVAIALQMFVLDNPVFRWIWSHVWYFIGFYCLLPVLAYFVLPFFATKKVHKTRPTVLVMVLGDLGHLPRMCYHARSLSKLGHFVNLCGYVELEPFEFVVDDPYIDIHEIEPIFNVHGLPFAIFAAEKLVLQLVRLFKMLLELGDLDYYIIQNPPLIPLVLLVVAYIRLLNRRAKLVIDWHNLNWSILNLRYQNPQHWAVKLLKLYEKWVVARQSDLHLCVTKLMKRVLIDDFGIAKSKIHVVYDRPAEQMAPLADAKATRAQLFDKYRIDAPQGSKLVVLLTSFTPDEDFNVLLDALEKLPQNVGPLVVVVTGKGPMKQQFLLKVRDLKFDPKRLVVTLVWLQAEDYPAMIASADLGVSLHTSLSGVDLPMKILDMFGGGVPVVSVDFPAISELVIHEKNGLVTLPKDMHTALARALTDKELYDEIKLGAMAESVNKWDANWQRTCILIFT